MTSPATFLVWFYDPGSGAETMALDKINIQSPVRSFNYIRFAYTLLNKYLSDPTTVGHLPLPVPTVLVCVS